MANVTSDFSAFLNGSALKAEPTNYAVSKRFVDKKKNPVEWVLTPISSEQDEAIRKDCTKRVPVPGGHKGQYTMETDTDKYVGKMCVATVTYPNLNSVQLQDSYNCKDGESLLKKMLLPGEYTDLKAMVMEVNGYDMSVEDMVDEAKN